MSSRTWAAGRKGCCEPGPGLEETLLEIEPVEVPEPDRPEGPEVDWESVLRPDPAHRFGCLCRVEVGRAKGGAQPPTGITATSMGQKSLIPPKSPVSPANHTRVGFSEPASIMKPSGGAR